MWGISHATDLLSNRNESKKHETNILLICPSDPRSILKTIANALVRNQSECIRFYIVEEHSHVLARHVLLLHALFDEAIPVRRRAQMYLEIFGNEKITEKSAMYVQELARHLMDLVLDDNHLIDDMFDLSLLKQRDRDSLADVFESWRRPSNRIGVVDWDYHTSIKPLASIIHLLQFRNWRLTGQTYEFGAATYSVHNPTLYDLTLDEKERSIDVSTGPFVSLGIDCERTNALTEELFQVHNKGTGAEQHRYSATEVALFNITSFIWAVTKGQKYEMTISGDVFSGLGKENPMVESSKESPNKRMFCIVPVKGCQPLYRKQTFHNFFDCAFVAHNASSILEEERFYDLLEKKATLFVETRKFDLTKNESNKRESIANLRQLLSSVNAVEIAKRDGNKIDDLLQFTITKS
eukprot:CCRYP_017440-RA/>CCRYP_017440-RA protein AED:0.36 eAED:0.37 QI:0/0/0/1/0/0.5/2/0/408